MITQILEQKLETTFKASSGAQRFYFRLIESPFERMKIHVIGSSEKTISALVIMSVMFV